MGVGNIWEMIAFLKKVEWRRGPGGAKKYRTGCGGSNGREREGEWLCWKVLESVMGGRGGGVGGVWGWMSA